jgi:hypothetical protein
MMPIVIEEVVISVEVGNATSNGIAAPSSQPEDTQALVAECVERVLEILAQRQER